MIDVLAFVEHVHRHQLSDKTREVIEALAAPRPGTARECLDDAGIYHRTAAERLRRKRLPPARRWRQLGRGLRFASYLASHPEANETDVARALGYQDHAAVHHAMRRAFGVSPAAARNQPPTRLLARWWHRQEQAA